MRALVRGARRRGVTHVTLRLLEVAGGLFVIAIVVAMSVDPQQRKLGTPGTAWITYGDAIFAILTVIISVCGIGFIFLNTRRAQAGHRKVSAERLTASLTYLAVLIAGQRRAHVREAWQSDLERPRDLADGPDISMSRKVAYSVGLVRAGIRCRIDDAAVLWWRLADGVLASRSWSRLVLTSPCAIAIIMIVHAEGLYGLVINAGNLVAIGSVSAGLICGGRKMRKVTLKTARYEQDQKLPRGPDLAAATSAKYVTKDQ